MSRFPLSHRSHHPYRVRSLRPLRLPVQTWSIRVLVQFQVYYIASDSTSAIRQDLIVRALECVFFMYATQPPNMPHARLDTHLHQRNHDGAMGTSTLLSSALTRGPFLFTPMKADLGRRERLYSPRQIRLSRGGSEDRTHGEGV